MKITIELEDNTQDKEARILFDYFRDIMDDLPFSNRIFQLKLNWEN